MQEVVVVVVVEVVGKGSEEAQACLLPHDIFENKIRMKSFRITECSIFFNLIILVQQPHNPQPQAGKCIYKKTKVSWGSGSECKIGFCKFPPLPPPLLSVPDSHFASGQW